MKKVLFTATVDSHILNFHIPYLKWFKQQGYEVHVASNGNSEIPYVDKKYNISFERSPFKLVNLKVYNQLKEIIYKNNYKIIHCHTPMGSVLTRLAAKKMRKMGTKVLYTAHGFHFYKGASAINWLLYYPVEKWLSRYTDCLITINEEDYQRVNSTFKATSIEYVNGVGIDLNKFIPQSSEMKIQLREKYTYKQDDFILLFAGELSYRKHQDLLINAISLVNKKIKNIKLLLAGEGNLSKEYKEHIDRLNLQDNVKLLGYRKDIGNLMMLSDISVSSSRQEGLPVNVMEAMATGLPLIVSDCRGNRDLITDNTNGYVVGIEDAEGFADAIEKIYKSEELRKKFSKKSTELIDEYSLDKVVKKMEQIYLNYL